MKRHVAWLMACGVLAGCTSEPSPIDAPPAPTASNQANEHSAEAAGGAVGGEVGGSAGGSVDAPTAFHFKSGTLEIGDFDPYTLGDDIFDPCTEISPEEFAAAGFDNVEPIPEEYAGLARGLSTCEILDSRGRPIADISNSPANREVIEEKAAVFRDHTSRLLPTLFTYDFEDPNSTGCFAQVDTTRGGLSVGVPGLPGRDERSETCDRAIRIIEELHNSL